MASFKEPTGAWSRRHLLAGGGALALAGSAGFARARRAPRFVDGLSYLPEDLSDIAASGLNAFICDVSEVQEVKDADGLVRYLRTFEICDAALDQAVERLKGRPEAFVALRGRDIGKKPGAAAFLQFQSCEPIGADLSRLAYFHAKGLRVLQLTHHNNNLFGGGCIEVTPAPLTPLGIEGIGEMNRLRILPDVSHASEPTTLDVARVTKTPFVISHGACRALVDNPRCASDAMIRAVADRGGVMGIFMMSFWLTRAEPPTVEDYLAQIRHVIKVGGVNAVGIANDFTMRGQENLTALNNDNAEGVKEYLSWWTSVRARGVPGFEWTPRHVVIPELNNIHRMQLIYEALGRARFRSSEIEKIMGGNWIRVLNEVLV